MKKNNVYGFSTKSLLALGECYVYGLVDPRTNKIFYIGKGTGNRVFDHENESMMNPESEKLKLSTIKAIKDSGNEVIKLIIHKKLTEQEAFAAEAALINIFNYVEDMNLTNIVSGHHVEAVQTVEEFELLHGAEEITEKDIKHNLFVVKVNGTYKPGMTPYEVYEVVRGCWIGNYPYKMERLDKVDYIIGVYHGLVVGIFKPSKWEYVKDNPDEVPGRDRESADKDVLSARVYCVDYGFQEANPFDEVQYEEYMDEAQRYYYHKSIIQIDKTRRTQNPCYLP